MSKNTKTVKAQKSADAAHAQREKSAARVKKQVIASGEQVSQRPILDVPAKVAPLTLEQRAQLGDKAAQAELDAMEKKFDELTASASDAVAAKLKAKIKVKTPKAKKSNGGGCAEACFKLLSETKRAMDTHEMITELSTRGWFTTAAKKPADVLFGVMTYEIKAKGKESRFTKPAPGKFGLAK